MPGTTPSRPLTYLACPYTSKDPEVMKWRYKQANKAAARLIKSEGWNIFSPITHSHPLVEHGCTGDWEVWKKIDTEYLSISARLVVLMLDGWRESVGVQAEIKLAREMGIQIDYLAVCGDDGYAGTTNPDGWNDFGMDGEVTRSGVLLRPSPETTLPEGEVRIVDPNTGGQKGQKLARFDLIPAECLFELAETYGRGAKKYSDDNWRKGYSWKLSFGAMMRHAWKFWLGHDRDEDGNSHLSQVAWHAFTLLWYSKHGKGTDDRPSNVTGLVGGQPV